MGLRLAVMMRGRNYLQGILGVILALSIWQILPYTGLVTPEQIPPASSVLIRLVQLTSLSDFWLSIAMTVAAAGLGLLIAFILGVAIGALMGSFRVIYDALNPIVEFLRPVPGVALIPVAILMFGPGVTSDVSLVVFGCIWVLIIQTLYGVQALDEVALQTARSFRLNMWDQLRFVQIPSALPYIATGLRISSSIALIIAVTAELIAGNTGLGNSIVLAQSAARPTDMYAYIVTAGLLGIGIHILTTSMEERALYWHQSYRTGR